MTKKYIIGNLKMYGSISFYDTFFKKIREFSMHKSLDTIEIALCIPYPYLYLAQQILGNSGIYWGSQNVAKDNEGPFTGEVSAKMLKEFDSQFAIIGHSERNTAYCESDVNIAEKFLRIKEHNMRPIICVGETLIEREAGMEKKVVQSQLETLVNHGKNIFNDSIIAYEPIWAIGSDMSASPEQAKNMCAFIKEFVEGEADKVNQLGEENKPIKVIYGGSVNEKNKLQLLSLDEVDGALIGRCSLSPDKFLQICEIAHQL